MKQQIKSAKTKTLLIMIGIICLAIIPYVSSQNETNTDQNISAVPEPIVVEENATNATAQSPPTTEEQQPVQPIQEQTPPNDSYEEIGQPQETPPQQENAEIMLDDGTTITKAVDSQSLTIKKGETNLFEITSSQKMGYLGNPEETKEWVYQEAGHETVTSSNGLELVDEDYICQAGQTKAKTITQQQGIGVFAYENPNCIYYPKQYVANPDKKTAEDQETINARKITQLDASTFRVDFKENYDPTYLNYSGSCDSTCYIRTDYYNVTLTGGTFKSFKYLGAQNVEWTANPTGSGIGFAALFCNGTWVMDYNISSNCKAYNISNAIVVDCNNTGNFNNYTFRNSYIELDAKCTIGTMRNYFYSPMNGYNSSMYNITHAVSPATRWTDAYTPQAVVGYTYNTSKNLPSNMNTTYILAYAWNQSKTTGYGKAAGDPLATPGGIAIGRPSETPANNSLKIFIKVLQRNESATGDAKYTTVLQAFKNNPTFGDAPMPPKILRLNYTLAEYENGKPDIICFGLSNGQICFNSTGITQI